MFYIEIEIWGVLPATKLNCIFDLCAQMNGCERFVNCGRERFSSNGTCHEALLQLFLLPHWRLLVSKTSFFILFYAE